MAQRNCTAPIKERQQQIRWKIHTAEEKQPILTNTITRDISLKSHVDPSRSSLHCTTKVSLESGDYILIGKSSHF